MKTILKIIIGAVILFFILLLAGGIYVYIKKDQITKNLILRVNQKTSGELKIDDVTINLLQHFPNISLSLKGVEFFERKDPYGDSVENSLLNCDELYLAIDANKLLESKININGLTIREGQLNLIKHLDSSLNFSNTFTLLNDDSVGIESESGAKISISIHKLMFQNVELRYKDKVQNQVQTIKVNRANANLDYFVDSLACDLISSINIQNLRIGEIEIQEERLQVDADLFYDLKNKEIKIYEGDLKFRNASLLFDGFLNLAGDQNIDISFEANDADLKFTKLFLSSESKNDIEHGQLYLNGSIYGSSNHQLPEFDMDFGARDLRVRIPDKDVYLNDFDLVGHFSSGEKSDFSEAALRVDTISAALSSGNLEGEFSIKNFKNPTLKYNLSVSLDINELESIFDLGRIKDLHGHVEIQNAFNGYYESEKGWTSLDKEELNIAFHNASITIDSVLSFRRINGRVEGELDTISVNNLNIQVGRSAFDVDGTFYNISELIFNTNRIIRADLTIETDRYDFVDFFSYMPKVGRSFPYVISDVLLDLQLETSHRQLKDFKKVPELNFVLNEVNGKIESFLPKANLRNGTFRLHELDSTIVLDFQGFDIEIAGASAKADYTLYTKSATLDSMNIHLSGNNMNPAQIFYDPDTVDVA